MFFRTAALGVSALAFAGLATAQNPDTTGTPRGGSTPTFTSYDADRDGRVTRPEASTNVSLYGQFERLDRDNDDALDTGEFARFEAEAMSGEPAAPPDVPNDPIRPLRGQETPPPPE